jgi:hypothetical protein
MCSGNMTLPDARIPRTVHIVQVEYFADPVPDVAVRFESARKRA